MLLLGIAIHAFLGVADASKRREIQRDPEEGDQEQPVASEQHTEPLLENIGFKLLLSAMVPLDQPEDHDFNIMQGAKCAGGVLANVRRGIKKFPAHCCAIHFMKPLCRPENTEAAS